MQFCAAPGCGVLVPRGKCPTHTPHQRLSRPAYAKVHAWHNLQRWHRLRADVLRAEPFCRSCRAQGRKCLTVDVDHIQKHEGNPDLFWNRANLQGLCRSCHSRKTGQGG